MKSIDSIHEDPRGPCVAFKLDGNPAKALKKEEERNKEMFSWAFLFLLAALLAAVLGFGGLTVAIAGAARILSYLCLAASLFALIKGLNTRMHH